MMRDGSDGEATTGKGTSSAAPRHRHVRRLFLFRARWLHVSALIPAALLAACGGGSEGASGTVVVVPGPSSSGTSPTPTPSSTSPLTAQQIEDQQSNSAASANADVAYRAGATGRGVKIAIIDTGITPGLTEFSSRIDPASADMAGTRGLTDPSGHGTLMASVALAARDSRGMHGVAPEATLVSLNASNPATCRSADDCPASAELLIRAIDAAIDAKVRVINISATTDVTHETLIAAVRRAAAAGIVTVISAGNNNGDARQPLLLSRSFAEAAPGWVIIAGGHDTSGVFDYQFANRAGGSPAAAWYLTALSRDVVMTDRNGSLVRYSGTSPAAAAISGAVALVAQARPNLTGAQIVTLLLANTTDAGTPGPDNVFGRGILNIAAIFTALPPAG
ncbi:S8 family peptidase [uncultured Sphingomonas sp.]|uniref:S8 family peptidase n=1 Tax=uncultured Sphingomonas sp. TaxID=158754 RepID=UPI003749EA69